MILEATTQPNVPVEDNSIFVASFNSKVTLLRSYWSKSIETKSKKYRKLLNFDHIIKPIEDGGMVRIERVWQASIYMYKSNTIKNLFN